jgi:hypothetical protein
MFFTVVVDTGEACFTVLVDTGEACFTVVVDTGEACFAVVVDTDDTFFTVVVGFTVVVDTAEACSTITMTKPASPTSRGTESLESLNILALTGTNDADLLHQCTVVDNGKEACSFKRTISKKLYYC